MNKLNTFQTRRV